MHMSSPELGLNIATGQACNGDLGSYVGNLYHMVPHSDVVERTPVGLGGYRDYFEQPGRLLPYCATRANNQLGREIGNEELIALSLVRLCTRREHADPRMRTGRGEVLIERAASIVVSNMIPFQHKKSGRTEMTPGFEGILDLNDQEQELNGINVGKARFIQGGGRTVMENLIHLPLSPAEYKEYDMLTVVKGAVPGSSRRFNPCVTYHTRGRKPLEIIIGPDELVESRHL
jgi:hypothetical protein